MNSIDSIEESIKIIRKHDIPYALLHCTNIYPTPHHLVRLDAMIELNENFKDAVVGLSDHTTDNQVVEAVALGGSILETLHWQDGRKGPDIINSMDVNACNEPIQGSKLMKQLRGGKKGAVEEDKPTINFAYASIVAIKDINKGDKLTMIIF